MFKKSVVASALAFAALHSNAAITLAGAPSAADVVATIVGSGITATDPNVSWNAAGGVGVTTFTDGAASVGFASGVVLSTGDTGCVRTGNTQGGCTSPTAGANPAAPGTTSSVSFNFTVAQAGTLSFVYVFASEEYEPAFGSPNNDFANFFLTGPGGGTVDLALGKLTSVSSVGCGASAGQFIDNAGTKCADSGQTRDIEYDGLTTVQTVTAQLAPGSYTFSFHVSDAGLTPAGAPIRTIDSALFIQQDSFNFSVPTDPGTVPEPASWALAGFGLMAAAAARRRRAKA